MVETGESELYASLRGYLEELKESGIDELEYAPGPAREEGAPAQASVTVAITAKGNPQASLLFVRAGGELAASSRDLLVRMIDAMEFAMKDICVLSYLPDAPEGALRGELTARIKKVGPTVVVALGEEAAQLLLGTGKPIASLRGRFLDFEGTQLMATLHPDQLVADGTLKRQVWQELQQVMARLGKKRG